jgi:hypothetical protein
MEEELLLDEAARLYALSRQGDCRSRRLYRQVALDCCLVATELRAARQFPEGDRGAEARSEDEGRAAAVAPARAPGGSCRG